MSRFLNGSDGLRPTQPGHIGDEERSGLWARQNTYGWSYHQRTPTHGFQKIQASQPRWHNGAFAGTQNLLLGNSAETYSGRYDRWHFGGGSNRAWLSIRGAVLDASSAPVAGVTVKAFRTSDDLLVGTAISDDQGNYAVPTPYTGVSHYVVAYRPGSPDTAGNTVNNLTPSA